MIYSFQAMVIYPPPQLLVSWQPPCVLSVVFSVLLSPYLSLLLTSTGERPLVQIVLYCSNLLFTYLVFPCNPCTPLPYQPLYCRYYDKSKIEEEIEELRQANNDWMETKRSLRAARLSLKPQPFLANEINGSISVMEKYRNSSGNSSQQSFSKDDMNLNMQLINA